MPLGRSHRVSGVRWFAPSREDRPNGGMISGGEGLNPALACLVQGKSWRSGRAPRVVGPDTLRHDWWKPHARCRRVPNRASVGHDDRNRTGSLAVRVRPLRRRHPFRTCGSKSVHQGAHSVEPDPVSQSGLSRVDHSHEGSQASNDCLGGAEGTGCSCEGYAHSR